MTLVRTSIAAAAAAAALGLALASPASAAHCGDGPGFSGFGTHAQATTDAEGSKEGPHMGTSGASNCRETTGSPAERAPGKNG